MAAANATSTPARPTSSAPATVRLGIVASMFTTVSSGDPVKNARPPTPPGPTTRVTEPNAPRHPHDGHITAAVLIGLVLLSMIVAIVGVFLWRRWRKAAAPVAHWAGRSPFADGEVLDVSGDREAAGQGSKRTSILSHLPWKFSKEEELLESTEGQLEESRGSVDNLPPCGADEAGGQPSLAETDESVLSASTQTHASDGRASMTEIPLQLPELQDLPAPPVWCQAAGKDLCPNGLEGLSPCPEPLALCPPGPGEVALLPPPPEDLL